MRRKIWKPDLDATAELIQKLDDNELLILFQKVYRVSSPEEVALKLLRVSSLEEAVVKLIKTEEQRQKVIELLQQDGEISRVSSK